MKAITVAVAALAVFALALGMIASAPSTAPAAQMDRCLLCHPQAHPSDWTQTSHVTDLQAGVVSTTDCSRCHDQSYCNGCHAQVQAMQQQLQQQQQAQQQQRTPAQQPVKATKKRR